MGDADQSIARRVHRWLVSQEPESQSGTGGVTKHETRILRVFRVFRACFSRLLCLLCVKPLPLNPRWFRVFVFFVCFVVAAFLRRSV